MENKPDRVLILNITIVVEAVLLLLSTFWTQLAEIPLFPLLHINSRIITTGLLAGFGTALVGFCFLWLPFHNSKAWPWFAPLKEIVIDEVAPLFANFTWRDIVLVAAASGFCEEIFFRGVVQSQLGLFAASLLFGFLHCPSPRHLPYGLWAFLAGTFLGWLLLFQNSLWAPIIAHATSNLLVLFYLRYVVKQRKTTSEGSKS